MRIPVFLCALLVVPVLAETQTQTQASTAFVGGRVIDGTGKVIDGGIVVVTGDRITAAGSASTPIPAGATRVDLKGKTITITNGATDIDIPEQNLTFSLEAGAPEGAVIDSKTGTLEWTPTPAQSPSTNVIGIRVTDDGVPAMSDVKYVTVSVNKVNTAPRMVYYY